MRRIKRLTYISPPRHDEKRHLQKHFRVLKLHLEWLENVKWIIRIAAVAWQELVMALQF